MKYAKNILQGRQGCSIKGSRRCLCHIMGQIVFGIQLELAKTLPTHIIVFATNKQQQSNLCIVIVSEAKQFLYLSECDSPSNKSWPWAVSKSSASSHVHLFGDLPRTKITCKVWYVSPSRWSDKFQLVNDKIHSCLCFITFYVLTQGPFVVAWDLSFMCFFLFIFIPFKMVQIMFMPFHKTFHCVYMYTCNHLATKM